MADRDLTGIYLYSYENFGEARADAYLTSLDECFGRLASNPSLGVDVGRLREGYRRYTHNRHDIYYRAEAEGILVVRVLGPGVSVDRHLP